MIPNKTIHECEPHDFVNSCKGTFCIKCGWEPKVGDTINFVITPEFLPSFLKQLYDQAPSTKAFFDVMPQLGLQITHPDGYNMPNEGKISWENIWLSKLDYPKDPWESDDQTWRS